MNVNALSATLLIALLATGGCSSRTDSTQQAERINNAKIDKQAVAVSSDAKDDAKDVTKAMVELANTSRTELELSNVAARKATNPEVRAFALRAVSDHGQDDRQLETLAKQMNVTLPADLSDKGKSHLSKLTGMKASTEFDTQYLDYMAAVNDEALDAADKLRDNAPTDAVKTFAKKIMDDDKKHKAQAKQLKNVLD